MKAPYRKVDYATLFSGADEIIGQRDEANEENITPLAEFPSSRYKTHDLAYMNDDVIKIYAVIEEATGDLYLELVSEKWSRVEYIRLELQDRTNPLYGKVLDDEAFRMHYVDLFDHAIHKEKLIVNN